MEVTDSKSEEFDFKNSTVTDDDEDEKEDLHASAENQEDLELSAVPRNFRCNVCGESFKSPLSVSNHKKKEHSMEFKCKICDDTFEFEEYLSIHEQFHNNEVVKCSACRMIFTSATSLIEHSQVHKDACHACDVCGKLFKVYSSMTSHRRTIHSLASFPCKICEKMFSTRVKLQNHLAVHDKGYICRYCNEIFITRYARLMHYHNKHSDVMKHCAKCDIKYERLNDLKCHKSFHAYKTPYLCIICLKSFSALKFLKEHHLKHALDAYEEVMTGVEKPKKAKRKKRPYERGFFLCDICGKYFSRERYLQDHKTTHGPPGSHQCSYCGKVYSYLVGLKEHLKRHKKKKSSGDSKPDQIHQKVPCNICHKIFSSQKAISNHKKIHTDSFACNICLRIFNKKSNLRTHYLTHTGEKPHKCPYCECKYADRSNLKKHMLKHPAYAASVKEEAHNEDKKQIYFD